MKLKLLSKKVKVLLSVFLFFGALAVQAQTFEIKGVVSDESGTPLPGVSIHVKNTSRGTTTDVDGRFALADVQNGDRLIFSFIGFKTLERVINNESVLDVSLTEETTQLSEIVVTALGVKRETKALGYATQEVKGESLQKVQGVDAATSLSGKVAGVLISNPTDFNVTPIIQVRGESPLLVINGVPYENKTLNDIAAEDIETINVLKGATASALYGSRGGSGAIMITTKNGSEGKNGVTVEISSNTMFTAGYLAVPEKQSVYGRGTNNTYQQNQYQSWGAKMDGSIQNQWDPIAKEYRDYEYLPVGKDNLNNFLEQGYITNNNVNVTFKENTVALRNSVNWTENKARYPNAKVDKFSYLLGGDIFLDKFQLTSNLSYTRRHTPNMGSNGYTSYDPMYTLLLRSTADYDIRDYKDNYWLIPGELQNNMYGYDLVNDSYTGQDGNNPYYDRYERVNEVTRDIFNADVTASYAITPWLKATIRSGLDYFGDRGELRLNKGSYTSLGDTGIPYFTYRSGLTFNGKTTGAYLVGKTTGLSTNSDLLLTGGAKFLDDRLGFEYLAGGSIFYAEEGNINALTVGGLSDPGYYSLAASVSPATVAEERRAQQTNSLYGRLALSWNNLIYIEATGRNDWASTLAGPTVQKSDRSYFYPSVAGSLIVSEFMKGLNLNWLDLLKVRASWTQSKVPPSVFFINSVYSPAPSIWNDLSGAISPDVLYDLQSISPESRNTTEVGLQGMFLKNRLTADVAYYSKRNFDKPVKGPLSSTTGYNYKFINTDEETTQKGWEIALTGTPVKTADLQWDLGVNWSTYKEIYTKLDTVYSTQRPWVKEGERVDAYTMRRFQTVPSGEYAGQRIYQSGKLVRENFFLLLDTKTQIGFGVLILPYATKTGVYLHPLMEL